MSRLIAAIQAFASELYTALSAVFIVTFVALGFAFTLLFPPFQVPDEDLHWLNGYDKVERFLSALSGTEPVKCNTGIGIAMHFDANPLKSNTTVKAAQDKFSSLGNVKPTCWQHVEIPSSSVVSYPGLALARMFIRSENTLPERSLIVHYLARFFQGALIAFALLRAALLFRRHGARLIAGSLTIMAYTLSPMFVNQAFGVTYDSVTLLLVVTASTLLFFNRYAASFDYLFFSFAALAAASSKPPYFALAAAVPVFIATVQAFEWFRARGDKTDAMPVNRWKPALGQYLPIGIALIAALVLIARTSQVTFTVPAGIDPAYNKQFLLNDLGRALHILWDSPMTLVKMEYMASVLGWTNVQISSAGVAEWLRIVYFAFAVDFALLLLCLLRRISEGNMSRLAVQFAVAGVASVPILLSAAMIIILSALSMYILWTPKDTIGVVGLQVRYFLGVFPITFCALPAIINYCCSSGRLDLDAPGVKSAWLGAAAVAAAALVFVALLAPYAFRICGEVVARFY